MMDVTDRMQKLFYKCGSIQKSIDRMNQFMMRIFDFYDKERELEEAKKEV